MAERWFTTSWKPYCLRKGHDWEEHKDYEDAGYPVHVRTWRECTKCEKFEETWNIYDET